MRFQLLRHGPSDGLDGKNWAQQEFGGAPLGDARLSARLVEIASAKAEKPGHAFAGVVEGDLPAVKAYYRLIDHPDETAVTVAHILQPHRERTVRRMQGQHTVLCIMDGTDNALSTLAPMDFTSLAQCEGLGIIGTNPDFSSIFHHLQVVACYRIKSSSTFPLTWQKTLAYVENAIPVALIGDGELG